MNTLISTPSAFPKQSRPPVGDPLGLLVLTAQLQVLLPEPPAQSGWERLVYVQHKPKRVPEIAAALWFFEARQYGAAADSVRLVLKDPARHTLPVLEPEPYLQSILQHLEWLDGRYPRTLE